MAFGNSVNMGGIPEQCFLLEKAEQIKTLANTAVPARLPLESGSFSITEPVKNPAQAAPNTNVVTTISALPVVPVRAVLGLTDVWADYRTHAPGGQNEILSISQLAIFSNKQYLDLITNLQTLSPGAYKALMELTPEEITQMSHFLDVEEVLTNPTNGKIHSRQSIFFRDRRQHPNHQDFQSESIYRSKGLRVGAGITNLTLTHEGIDSATKKVVKVDVTYTFQDIREMLSQNYIRLFDQTGFKQDEQGERRPRSIDFTLGWVTPNDSKIRRTLRSKGLDPNSLRFTVRTHMVSYTFDLNQDGSLTVKATYRGQILDGMSGPGSNILELAKSTFEQFNGDIDSVQKRAVAYARTSQSAFEEQLARSAVVQKLKLILAGEAQRLAAVRAQSRNLAPNGQIITSNNVIAPEFRNLTSGLTSASEAVDSLSYFLFGSAGALAPTTQLRGGSIGLADPSLFAQGGAFEGLDGQVVADEINNLRQTFFTFFDNTSKVPGLFEIGDFLSQIDIIDTQYQKAEDTLQTNVTEAITLAFAEQTRIANFQKFKALTLLAEKMVNTADLHHYIIDKSDYTNNIDPLQTFQASMAVNDVAAATTAINNLRPSFLVNHVQLRELFYPGTGVPAGTHILGTNPPTTPPPGPLSATPQGRPKQFDENRFTSYSFVYLGHLIENVLRLPTGMDFTTNPPTPRAAPNVSTLIRQRGPEMRIDLGLLNFKRPLSGTEVTDFPLYFLPISHKLLNDFFSREVISKGKQYYPLHEFIMDLLKKALPAGFNKCADMSGGQAFVPPKLQLTVTNHPENTKENVFQYFIHGFKSVIQDLRDSGITNQNFGNYNINLQNKIPHFFFYGRNKGIDQEIKLIDITDSTIKSAAYFRSISSKQGEFAGGLERKTGFVPIIFQTEIKTIGYPFAHVGQLVFITLDPFIVNTATSTTDAAGESARMLAATGYYNIHKVSHTFSQNGFFTNMSGILQLSAKDKQVLDPQRVAVTNPQQTTTGPAVSAATTTAINAFQQEIAAATTKYRDLRTRINNSATQAERDAVTGGETSMYGFDFRKRQP